MSLRTAITRTISNVFRIYPKTNYLTLKRNLNHDIHVAIVGSGPAGFYTAQKLLKNPLIKVDIYEKLPVPFGLVRFGVAPDHPDVKNVINTFTNVANDNRVNFLGNVSIGQDIALKDLFYGYHAVVLCYGSSLDRYLNIEGESSPNVVSARQLVGWYNGVPADKDLKINLDCDTACIIGQGNVAIDCARILLKPPGLHKTDISSQAYERIAKSKIRKIVVVGRRGPIQIAFTIKEFRELLKAKHCSISIASDIKHHLHNTELLNSLSRPRYRLIKLIEEVVNKTSNGQQQQHIDSSSDGYDCEFRFLRSPMKIVLSNKNDDLIERVIFTKNHFKNDEDFYNEKASVISNSEDVEELKCGLVIRSIGYKPLLIDNSLPYDHKKGVIINHGGRVQGFTGLYCSGWLATGPTGVIASTLQSSLVTSKTIFEDISEGTLPELRTKKQGYKLILEMLKSKSVEVVHFNEWLKIDKMEKKIGELMGKPREKLIEVSEMLKVAKSDHK